MMHLRGEPIGLSIGGLVVIDKSLVISVFLLVSLHGYAIDFTSFVVISLLLILFVSI